MTRINIVPPSELSDQHLIAEYRELPRVLKQDINISDAPDTYCLGRGHMKWAKRHSIFVRLRYMNIIKEMQYRGFTTNYGCWISDVAAPDYIITDADIELNRQRIREKYQMKPNWYRWTKRTKPNWL